MRAGDFLRGLKTAPVASLDELVGGNPFLVLAPHPDDETLGCAGLIMEARAAGIPLRLVVVTDGSASHPGSKTYPASRLTRMRRDESLAAARICGVPDAYVHFLGVRDSHIPKEGDSFEAAVSALEAVAGETRAKSVFVTWRRDPHCDHEAAYDIALTLARRMGLRLWAFPIWGWTLPPDEDVVQESRRRLDISRWRDRKALAIACHRSQTTRLIDDDPDGFILTPEVLARFTGDYEYFIEVGR